MAEQEKGFIGRVFSHLWDRFKAIPREVDHAVWNKVGPQGATELAQAMYAGHAFTPYGDGQHNLTAGPQQSYNDMLDRYAAQASKAEPAQEQGRDL